MNSLILPITSLLGLLSIHPPTPRPHFQFFKNTCDVTLVILRGSSLDPELLSFRNPKLWKAHASCCLSNQMEDGILRAPS